MIRFFLALMAVARAGSISGTVVESSGDAVRKAVVTLTWQGTPRSWATARTDGSGQFRFDGLPAGKYDLRASKAGEGTAIFGANSPLEMGELISLEEGQARAGLKLQFVHSSSIAGRILDPEGDPVQGAAATLLREARNLGARILVNHRSAMSNDRGEYRITAVEPGRYYLHTIVNGNHRGSLLVSEFYGGAVEWKDARPITIRTGEALTGVDFRLNAAPAVEIRGRVSGWPQAHNDVPTMEDAARWIEIMLSPLEDFEQRSRIGTAAQGTDGRFSLPAVAAGRYRIEARARIDKTLYTASQVVDAAPGMGEVELEALPGVSLKGQLTIEGKSNQKASDFRVTLASWDTVPAAVGADGKFTFDQIAPGEWEMNLNPVPRLGYLKSVLLGDKDVRFAKIPVERGSDATLKIVVSMRTASIEGDAGPARAGILLAPVGELHDMARFYYGVATDADGKFKMSGIAPGKYRIYALENMAVANFRSPEAADQLGDLGEEIELAEGATVTVHPKLIPVERAREALR
jgi:hypothetical protein